MFALFGSHQIVSACTILCSDCAFAEVVVYYFQGLVHMKRTKETKVAGSIHSALHCLPSIQRISIHGWYISMVLMKCFSCLIYIPQQLIAFAYCDYLDVFSFISTSSCGVTKKEISQHIRCAEVALDPVISEVFILNSEPFRCSDPFFHLLCPSSATAFCLHILYGWEVFCIVDIWVPTYGVAVHHTTVLVPHE